MSDPTFPSHAQILDEIRALRDTTSAWRALDDARIAGFEGRLTAVEVTLKRNTELTEQVRDAVVAAKVAHAVLKWASGLTVAAAAAWYALKPLWSGTPPGPGG